MWTSFEPLGVVIWPPRNFQPRQIPIAKSKGIPMPMPTPMPVLALWLIPELVALVATAVDEAGFDGCVEVMGKGTGEVMVMNVEVEDDDDGDNEDDETVALVEAEGASIILKLPLLNASVVLPG